jgi:hypothetical protein
MSLAPEVTKGTVFVGSLALIAKFGEYTVADHMHYVVCTA